MSEENEELQMIVELMRDLEQLKDTEIDLKVMLEEAAGEDAAKIRDLDDQVEKLLQERDALKAQMREDNPELYSDLITCRSMIESKENAVKKACYGLPLDVSRKGVKLLDGRVSVKMSRSATKITYKEDVLDDHPEFDEMYLDGDPLVQRKINSDILERLVREGTVSEAAVAPYRIEVRPRNPSVRIEFKEEG